MYAETGKKWKKKKPFDAEIKTLPSTILKVLFRLFLKLLKPKCYNRPHNNVFFLLCVKIPCVS